MMLALDALAHPLLPSSESTSMTDAVGNRLADSFPMRKRPPKEPSLTFHLVRSSLRRTLLVWHYLRRVVSTPQAIPNPWRVMMRQYLKHLGDGSRTFRQDKKLLAVFCLSAYSKIYFCCYVSDTNRGNIPIIETSLGHKHVH